MLPENFHSIRRHQIQASQVSRAQMRSVNFAEQAKALSKIERGFNQSDRSPSRSVPLRRCCASLSTVMSLLVPARRSRFRTAGKGTLPFFSKRWTATSPKHGGRSSEPPASRPAPLLRLLRREWRPVDVVYVPRRSESASRMPRSRPVRTLRRCLSRSSRSDRVQIFL